MTRSGGLGLRSDRSLLAIPKAVGRLNVAAGRLWRRGRNLLDPVKQDVGKVLLKGVVLAGVLVAAFGWVTPKIDLYVGALVVVALEAAVTFLPESKEKPNGSQRAALTGLLFVSAAAVVGAASLMRETPDQFADVEPLTGSFNVGVVPFFRDSELLRTERAGAIAAFESALSADLLAQFAQEDPTDRPLTSVGLIPVELEDHI